MITEKEIKENWIEIAGTESVAKFLDGRVFLNPDYLTRIKNTIDSYETAKGLKK